MKRHAAAKQSHWLEVRVRTTVGGEGAADRALSVFCGGRGLSVPILDCVACTSCSGFRIDESGRQSFLRCDGHAAPRDYSAPALASGPEVPLSAVMTPAVVCVRPDLEIEALVGLMIEHGVSGVPVVNHAGQAIGMVSKTDLVQEFGRRNQEEDEPTEPLKVHGGGVDVELGPGFHLDRMRNSTVADIMTPLTFALAETVPLVRAAALMAYEGVHRIVVTGAAGEVVGILTTLDVVRWLAREGGYDYPHQDPGH